MRLCIMFMSVVLLMTAGVGSGYAHVVDQPQQDIPSYAKWGRLAMKETKSRYPDADIIDYLHQGREDQEDATVEKFKLWLREDTREFGVFINIAFDNETEKVRDISFEETSR